MFVANVTGADIFIHEINKKIPSGDKIYQIPNEIVMNHVQLTKIPDFIVKKIEDTMMALEKAEKTIEQLEKNLNISTGETSCCGNCQCENKPEEQDNAVQFCNVDSTSFDVSQIDTPSSSNNVSDDTKILTINPDLEEKLNKIHTIPNDTKKLTTKPVQNKSSKPAGKKISVDGVVYDTYMEASRLLGIKYLTLLNRVKSKKFPEYKTV